MARKSSEARAIHAERNAQRRARSFERSSARASKAEARVRFGGAR